MWAVWLLFFLALSCHSTEDIGNLKDVAGKEPVEPGHLSCLKMGAELSRLSAQNEVTRKLLSGKSFNVFLI